MAHGPGPRRAICCDEKNMTDSYTIPDALLARCVGKRELVRRVLTAFVDQINDDLPRLSAVVAEGDLTATEKAAHRIKGSAANVAADDLRALAEQMESSARDGVQAAVEETLQQFAADWERFVSRTSDFLA